jgi:hypothetical protein
LEDIIRSQLAAQPIYVKTITAYRTLKDRKENKEELSSNEK